MDITFIVLEPSGLVVLLHSYGYQVHVYTIRNDDLHVTYNQVYKDIKDDNINR